MTASGVTITPTFACFDDAVDAVADALSQEGPEWVREHLRVVHGICLAPEGPRKDEPFAHAWVEVDRTMVVQGGILDGTRKFYVCHRRDMYRLLRVQVTTVYTVDEMILRNRVSMHVGPWEPTYRALCSSDRTVFKEEA